MMSPADQQTRWCAMMREAQTDPSFLVWKYIHVHEGFIYQPQERGELFRHSEYIIFSLSGDIWCISPSHRNDPANHNSCNSIHGDQHDRYRVRRRFWEHNKDICHLFHAKACPLLLRKSNMLPRFREFRKQMKDNVQTFLMSDLAQIVVDYFMFFV